YDRRNRQCFPVHLLQSLHWSVGICVRLEINEKFAGFVPHRKVGNPPLYLFPDRYRGFDFRRPECTVIAINTTRDTQGPVPIGTGKAGIHIDFINDLAEYVPKVLSKGEKSSNQA